MVMDMCFSKLDIHESTVAPNCFNPIQDGHFWGCSRMGVKKAPQNLSHVSCNYETWHSYALPNEDPKGT